MFLLLFIFGAVIASTCMCYFANRNQLSHFLFSRSSCDHCSRVLKWYHLLPVVSFVLARGRCTYCRARLSYYYLVGELLTGFCFAYFIPTILEYHISFWFIFFTLILMMLSDLTDYFVSDSLQALLLLSVIVYIINTQVHFSFYSFLLLTIIFIIVYSIMPQSLGGADVKLALILSLLIDVHQLPLFLFIASSCGLVAILIAKVRYLPFIPFLTISFLLLYVKNPFA